MQRTYSAHAVRMQCACSAHAVRMQCSSRGAPSSATVDAGMPKPRRKVSQKVVYTMARSKVSEERERSFLRPWSALGVGVGVGPGLGLGSGLELGLGLGSYLECVGQGGADELAHDERHDDLLGELGHGVHDRDVG